MTIALYSVVRTSGDDGPIVLTMDSNPDDSISVFRLPMVAHAQLRDSLCEWRGCKRVMKWVGGIVEGLDDKDFCHLVGSKMLALGAYSNSKNQGKCVFDDSQASAGRTKLCLQNLCSLGLVEELSREGSVSAWRLSSQGFHGMKLCVDLNSGACSHPLACDPALPLSALSPCLLLDKLLGEQQWACEVVAQRELNDVPPYIQNGPRIMYKQLRRKTISTSYMLALADAGAIFKDSPALAIAHGEKDAYYMSVYDKHRIPTLRQSLAIGYQEDSGMLALEDRRRKRKVGGCGRGRGRGGKVRRVKPPLAALCDVVPELRSDSPEDKSDSSDGGGGSNDSIPRTPMPGTPRSDPDDLGRCEVGSITPSLRGLPRSPRSPTPLPSPNGSPDGSPRSPRSPTPLPSPAIAAAAGRFRKAGEWEDYFSNRLTKKKAKGVWVGWQIICMRHSNPLFMTGKDKCSRSANFAQKNLGLDTLEFHSQNDLLLNKLKHWAVTGHGYTRYGHINDWEAPEGTIYPVPEVELDTLAHLSQMEVFAADAGAADADDGIPGEVLVPVYPASDDEDIGGVDSKTDSDDDGSSSSSTSSDSGSD
jgi:hypothetical protein